MKEYLILADVKAVVSLKVQADNQQEAEMIAQRQLNDLSVANIEMNLKQVNGEAVNPNIEDFSIEVSSVQ